MNLKAGATPLTNGAWQCWLFERWALFKQPDTLAALPLFAANMWPNGSTKPF
jgi:hypothetical protein